MAVVARGSSRRYPDTHAGEVSRSCRRSMSRSWARSAALLVPARRGRPCASSSLARTWANLSASPAQAAAGGSWRWRAALGAGPDHGSCASCSRERGWSGPAGRDARLDRRPLGPRVLVSLAPAGVLPSSLSLDGPGDGVRPRASPRPPASASASRPPSKPRRPDPTRLEGGGAGRQRGREAPLPPTPSSSRSVTLSLVLLVGAAAAGAQRGPRCSERAGLPPRSRPHGRVSAASCEVPEPPTRSPRSFRRHWRAAIGPGIESAAFVRRCPSCGNGGSRPSSRGPARPRRGGADRAAQTSSARTISGPWASGSSKGRDFDEHERPTCRPSRSSTTRWRDSSGRGMDPIGRRLRLRRREWVTSWESSRRAALGPSEPPQPQIYTTHEQDARSSPACGAHRRRSAGHGRADARALWSVTRTNPSGRRAPWSSWSPALGGPPGP